VRASVEEAEPVAGAASAHEMIEASVSV